MHVIRTLCMGVILQRNLQILHRKISLAPDQPYIFLRKEFEQICSGVRYNASESVFTDFHRASLMAHRIEKSIKVIGDDLGRFISRPLQAHISFFKKEERQTFFEIFMRFPDDWSGRVYETSVIGHGKIPHLVGS